MTSEPSAGTGPTSDDAEGAVFTGRRLGVYQVYEQLGAGGMGEVYRARDTRLGRDVAVKILPRAFVADPDRLARFEREARVLAALNHPNIATIHGIEETGSISALVMELVDGATLAERITQGRVEVREALGLARQIADALDAAHEKEVVHRDLKPANIKVRSDGTVKVLDFGLAKFMTGDSLATDVTQSPTVTAGPTCEGMILGTAPYMSPEQARGHPIDKRTDIWAFGCILYEMLTGHALFARNTLTDTLAAVVNDEPDWSRLPPDTPGAVRRLLRRCLEREQKRRLRDIGDARVELEAEEGDARRESELTGQTAAAAGASARRRRWALVGAAGLVVAASAIASVWITPPFGLADPMHALRLSVNPPPGGEFRLANGSAISPDGRLIVYVAHTGDVDRLWLRPLGSLSARELPGTDGATSPFWSADSRSVGFFASGKLQRTDVAGGSPVPLCNATRGRGGTWNAEGVILFNGYNDGPILMVSAAGGDPVPLTTIDESRTENSHRWPQFLPDGRQFLYFVRADSPQVQGVYLGSLDRPDERRRLLGSTTAAWYAPAKEGQRGHLLWVRDDRLVAQPFDPATAQLTDDAMPIADGPFAGTNNRDFFATSAEGTLLYEKAPGSDVLLTWYGRDGNVVGTVGQPGPYGGDPKISPDGKRIAVRRGTPPQIWVVDIDRGVAGPFGSQESSGVGSAAWSPDGQIVAVMRGAPPNLFLRGADGTDRRLTNTRSTQQLWDWSRDGRLLLYTESQNTLNATTRVDLWVVPTADNEAARQLTRGPSSETQGRFSPDGRWITYTSDESGRNEIYLRRVDGGMNWRVSTAGGSDARWRADGREVFYRAPDGTLMSVNVRTAGNTPELGSPVTLFKIPAGYDTSADGQRFLALASVEKAEASPMIVVTNWQTDLQGQGTR